MRLLSIIFLSLQVTLVATSAEEPKTFIVNHAWSEFINSSVHRIGYQFNTLPNPAVASVINGITIEWSAGDVIRSTTGAFMLEDGIWVQLDNDPTPTPLRSVFDIPDVTNVNPGGDTIQNQWVLKWDVATGRLVPATDLIGDASGGIYYFRDLYDVDVTNPQTGDIPVYNATTGMWENATPLPVVGYNTPTPQPTATPAATATPIGGWEFFATPTPQPTATPAETPTPAATPTPFSVELAMPTPVNTPTPMNTPTPAATATPNSVVSDQRLEASFPIYIASASCGVLAEHSTLDSGESILSVIDVQLGGINIPVEQCIPVSSIGSATRNDALRIYQRWCWFRTTDKPAGMAHVVIGDVTP